MEIALRGGRVDWRALKNEISYKDFMALVGHCIKKAKTALGEEEMELTPSNASLVFPTGDPYFNI